MVMATSVLRYFLLAMKRGRHRNKKITRGNFSIRSSKKSKKVKRKSKIIVYVKSLQYESKEFVPRFSTT